MAYVKDMYNVDVNVNINGVAGLLGNKLYIYMLLSFAVGMASEGLRLAKKNKFYYFGNILIRDGRLT